MPIYSYKCTSCTHEEDKIVSYDKRLEQLCDKCKEKTELQPSFKTGGVLGLDNGYAPTRSKSRRR